MLSQDAALDPEDVHHDPGDRQPNPENRPWRITKSPSATTKPGSYFKVGGAAFTSSNSPSRPGAMWAL